MKKFDLKSLMNDSDLADESKKSVNRVSDIANSTVEANDYGYAVLGSLCLCCL